MNEGKKFENNFKDSVPKNHFVYRLRDAGSYVGGKQTGEGRSFTTSNICDFIYFDGKLLMNLELKSVKDSRMPFTNIAKNRKSQLKKIDTLLKYSAKKNTLGAFVINFRSLEKTIVIEVEVLKYFIEKADKKSINFNDAKAIGVEIPQELKIVNWKYDLNRLSKRIITSYLKYFSKKERCNEYRLRNFL